MNNNITLIISAIVLLTACTTKNKKVETKKIPSYPITDTIQQIDTYFGTEIQDPFRWLEDDRSQKTSDWVDAQNKYTFGILDKIPFRDKIKKRLTKVWNYEKESAPFQKGNFWYFYKNDGLQNQSVLFQSDNENGKKAKEFLNPNTLNSDGTAALGGVSFSKNGDFMAYGINEAGSDWQTIYIKNTKTGENLTEKLDWCKFTGMAWQNNGFYYSRYDAPTGSELSAKNEYHKVYYHSLNTPQSEDKLVFEQANHPKRYMFASTSDDENILVVSVSEGTSGNILYIKDLRKKDSEFIPLNTSFEYDHSFLHHSKNKLFIYTNLDAPRYKIVEVALESPTQENWQSFVPQHTIDVLKNANFTGGKWFLNYMHDAYSKIYQFSEQGKLEKTIDLPTMGSVSGFDGKPDAKEIYYSFNSFTYPTTIFKYNIKNGTSELYKKSKVDFDSENYETKQIFYTSKDGTKVPMFIVHKKGLVLDGSNPTYLYSYGGFNISLNPNFDVKLIPWLENGGVYAMPNIRGGGEYGEEWHKAGMLLNKQNVFDDFIAAAEYLLKEKYTSSSKLCISGRSNGGLLVGATITQRPDLCAVALPGVGVLDMLRYHTFTIGWGWAVEYGSSDDSIHFDNLLKYSPLHNVKEANYPATMVYTADHDDRVVPSHSFKFVSELQRKNTGNNPITIRIDKNAGHGAGKPTSKQIDEWTDIWSFVLMNMNEEF